MAPVITSEPGNWGATGGMPGVGSSVTLTVYASGTPAPTFSWERSTDRVTWQAVSGGTVTTYPSPDYHGAYTFTAQLSDNGVSFRAKATNTAGTAISAPATLTVGNASLLWEAVDTWGLAVDSADRVIVSGLFDVKIRVFTSTGTPVTSWGTAGTGPGEFNGHKFITTDGSDNIYVPDGGNSRVQVFDSRGAFKLMFGSHWEPGYPGTGDGGFNGPNAAAVDTAHGWLYVVDTNNSRIQKFDLSGNYLSQWGSYGTDNGQFRFVDFAGGTQGPEGGIALDGSGNVYVVDNFNCRVQKFSSDGTYLTQWGGQGSGDAQFLFPSGIAIDKTRNRVYVVDSSTANNSNANVCKVAVFDLSGTYLGRWAPMSADRTLENAIGIATDSKGAVYVGQGHRVGKYIPDYFVK